MPVHTLSNSPQVNWFLNRAIQLKNETLAPRDQLLFEPAPNHYHHFFAASTIGFFLFELANYKKKGKQSYFN